MYKHCPRCAGNLKKQSPEMALCQTCGFEFYEQLKVTVNVILTNTKGEVLLARRKHEPYIGTWNTLGGHVNPGETMEEAARREVREESGLAVQDLKYFASYSDVYPYQGIPHKLLAIAFTGRALGKAKPGSDVSRIKFLPPKLVHPEDIPAKSDQKALRDFLRLTKGK